MLEDYAKEVLNSYIDTELQSATGELEEYDYGFIHGLQYALSLLENRPVIYVQKDRTYSEHDKKRFPEHFV